MTTGPLIALISATPTAIKPAVDAMSAAIPGVRTWNLLDDRLLLDAQEAGGVNDDLAERMTLLIRYAVDAGADGVLLTCSQYGGVAHSASTADGALPILGADDAAFDAVVVGGFRRVLVLASIDSSLADTTARLSEQLAENASTTKLVGRTVAGATQAAAAGDSESLSALLAEAVAAVEDVDAVLLAQYSLAPAQQSLADRFAVPVFAGPALSAARLASDLGRT